MKQISCADCKTNHCFIKSNCREKLLDEVNGVKQSSFYKKDQIIVFEGNPVLGLFFIQSGKVKVTSSGLNGRNQVVRLTKSGDIIGHRGYGGDVYPISAIAIDDTTICFIDNESIHEVFMNNAQLTFELMMYYSKELRNSEQKIKNLTQMNVREKVAEALIYAMQYFTHDNEIRIELKRQDIADLVGINTEQLSRIISEFKREAIISVAKNVIIIKRPSELAAIIKPFDITF